MNSDHEIEMQRRKPLGCVGHHEMKEKNRVFILGQVKKKTCAKVNIWTMR